MSPATAFTVTDIMPGDSGSQTIVVSNTGTGDARYSLSTSATNTDTKGLAAADDARRSRRAPAGAGATLYSGALGSAAFGSRPRVPRPATATCSRPARPTASASRGSFPLASGNAFQTAATTATFTFDAEQTANNP